MEIYILDEQLVCAPFGKGDGTRPTVAFPEWAGKIQGVGVQARYQYAQFPFTAGARE